MINDSLKIFGIWIAFVIFLSVSSFITYGKIIVFHESTHENQLKYLGCEITKGNYDVNQPYAECKRWSDGHPTQREKDLMPILFSDLDISSLQSVENLFITDFIIFVIGTFFIIYKGTKENKSINMSKEVKKKYGNERSA